MFLRHYHLKCSSLVGETDDQTSASSQLIGCNALRLTYFHIISMLLVCIWYIRRFKNCYYWGLLSDF